MRKFLLAFVFCFAACPFAFAHQAGGNLTGTVVDQGTKNPVDRVLITLSHGTEEFTTFSLADGSFGFHDLAPGVYALRADRVSYHRADLASIEIRDGEEAVVRIEMAPAPIQEQTVTVIESRLPVSSGTSRSKTFIQTEIAGSKAWQAVAATTPGVVLNPFGNMHIRGDHNLISFMLDDMLLPILPEGELGSLIDPRFLSGMEMRISGFSPSMYGQVGGVVTMRPRRSASSSSFEFSPAVGDHDSRDFLGDWSGRSQDNRWNYFVGGEMRHTDLRLEAPQPTSQTLNNAGDDTSALFHADYTGSKNIVNLDFGRQVVDFGIPNTPSSQTAGVNQHQRNTNDFALVSWEKNWSPRVESRAGISWLSSDQAVTNNGVFIPFVLADPATMPNANAAGLPANPTDYGSPYFPAIYRLNSQWLISADVEDRLTDTNHVEFGGQADFIGYRDKYDITDAGGSGLLPSSRVNVSFDRSGFSGGFFLSDHVTLGKRLHADAGAAFSRFDDGASVRTSQINPFVNMAFTISPTRTVRASYNHLFNVPPLEPDLSGLTALPEKADSYDLSYEQRLSPELRWQISAYDKVFRNQIDGSMLLPLSNVPLFFPTNFNRSIDDGIDVEFDTANKYGANGFLSYGYAFAKSPEQGYLDHDQRHTLDFGASWTWKNGAYASVDGEYGSGFPQAVAAAYNKDGIFPYGINGRVSNFVSNVNAGYRGKDGGASVEVLNLFNSTRDINFMSDFTGTRFTMERRVMFTLFANW